MWPYLYANLKTYPVLYFLSMALHFVVGLRLCRRLSLKRRTAFTFTVCYVFGMAIGARILFDLLHHRLDLSNYLHLSYYFSNGLWGGPLAYLMVAMPIALLTAGNKSLMADFVVRTLPAPMLMAKVACFFNGCCYGAESQLPWAISFPPGAEAPSGVARHPTALYEIGVLLMILFVFRHLNPARWQGWFALWFVFLYGLGRPLTEVFRAAEKRVPFVLGLSASQAVCLAAGALAGLGLLIVRKRWTNPPNKIGITFLTEHQTQ